jgi:hypothetical protein
METEMYTNDLHNAYTYETERRKDMLRDADQSRLARECKGDVKGLNAGLEKYGLLVVIGVLSALAWFLG